MFSLGRKATPKKKAVTKKRSIRKGRLQPHVDVRSDKELGDFEKLLGNGLTIVLVYADWCGHCKTFKQNTWNKVVNMPSRTLNISSVRDDMLPKTSLASAKINGYPSLLLVGDDKRPAEFTSPEGEPTNAMPNTEIKTLETMLKTMPDQVNSGGPAPSGLGMQGPVVTAEVAPLPPNSSADVDMTRANAGSVSREPAFKAPIAGGGLYAALATVAEKGAPAAIWLAAAAARSRKGRKTRKARARKGRKSLRRKRQSGGGCGATCPKNYWINELTGKREYGDHLLYENWVAPPGKMSRTILDGYVCQYCWCKQY